MECSSSESDVDICSEYDWPALNLGKDDGQFTGFSFM